MDAKLCFNTVLHRHEDVLANHPEHGVLGELWECAVWCELYISRFARCTEQLANMMQSGAPPKTWSRFPA